MEQPVSEHGNESMMNMWVFALDSLYLLVGKFFYHDLVAEEIQNNRFHTKEHVNNLMVQTYSVPVSPGMCPLYEDRKEVL